MHMLIGINMEPENDPKNPVTFLWDEPYNTWSDSLDKVNICHMLDHLTALILETEKGWMDRDEWSFVALASLDKLHQDDVSVSGRARCKGSEG